MPTTTEAPNGSGCCESSDEKSLSGTRKWPFVSGMRQGEATATGLWLFDSTKSATATANRRALELSFNGFDAFSLN